MEVSYIYIAMMVDKSTNPYLAYPHFIITMSQSLRGTGCHGHST